MATLDDIRAKLLSQQAKSENKGSGGGDRAMFPFWNTPEGQSSTIRFLPDADPNNTFFWVERLVIRLPFQGVKGEHDREVVVQVPCMEMYGESCPILSETRPWWKDNELQDLARKYWKKKSYIFQGFVVNSAFEEKDLPENPIRRFAINPSIFDIIKSSLMNPEMEDLPTDYDNGREFKLTKTVKGQYANYSTSNWSFKTRSLSDDERAAIDTHGLFNLKDFLPAKPSAEALEAIVEMFHASVNEEAYDPARWSNFYRPYGTSSQGGGAAKDDAVDDDSASAPAARPAPAPTPAPAAPAPAAAAAPKHDAADILARIKARNAGN